MMSTCQAALFSPISFEERSAPHERAFVVRLGLRGRKRNLFAHVVEELGTRIVRGGIAPNDPFPSEADLGREFGASRSVIREAVKSLAARGLIESRTRTGIRVLPSNQWNLLDAEVLSWRYSVMPAAQFYNELFEVRLMIEPKAAALAADRGTPQALAEIRKAFGEMTEAGRQGISGVEADLRFHQAILAASQNALLLQMGNLIAVGLYISHRISSESFTVFLPLHNRVLDAIVQRDATTAEQSMRQLLSETLTFVSRHLSDKPRQRTARRRAPSAV
jgi:GntR family transcriptional regulator, galactonate operon transcriptional repressor